VVEVESELKQLLRDRAEEAPTDPAITAQLLRRARSRRRWTVVLAGLITVAVVSGSVVGVRAILDIEPPRELAARPEWRGLWPQNTREKAVEAQEAADTRLSEEFDCTDDPQVSCLQDDILWQLDGVEVTTRYALEVLEWDRPFIEEGFDVSGADDPGPVLLRMGTCKTFATDACSYEARVTVERLIRPGRGGLWFVTGVGLSASVERAQAMVRAFLQARVDGSAADMYLSPLAKGIYDDHVEGLSLYGDFTGFRVLDAIVVREGVYRFEILLEAPEDTFENLSVGAGEGLDGTQRAAVILSATAPSKAPSSGISPDPGTDDEAAEPGFLAQAKDLVAAFMEARLQGSGAETYLTPYARQQYAAHEAAVSADEPGLYLYGNPHPEGDPSATYEAWRFEGVIRVGAETACAEFTDADCQGVWQIVVEVDVTYLGEGGQGSFQETLFVGPDDIGEAEIRGAFRGDVLVDDNP
jgi:hypothetical protein